MVRDKSHETSLSFNHRGQPLVRQGACSGFHQLSHARLPAVPAIAIHPPYSHYDSLFQSLTHQHGADAVCAAFLLVHGRRALRAYNIALGRHAELLVPLLTDATGAWVDARGGSRDAVSIAADTLVGHLLLADHVRSTGAVNESAGQHQHQAGPPQKQ